MLGWCYLILDKNISKYDLIYRAQITTHWIMQRS